MNNLFKFVDRTSIQYGKLKALYVDEDKTSLGKGTYWFCECDCGCIVSVRGSSLGKSTKSCGCLKRKWDTINLNRLKDNERFFSINEDGSRNRLYTIWQHMRGRCHNEKDYNYKRYGAIGISVCKEWFHDYEEFEKWSLKNGYTDELSIDRIDVFGNYEPENCRWANKEIQLNNKRNTLYVFLDGERISLKQAYNILKPQITYQTAKTRYHKGERNVEKLFSKNRRYRGN